MGVHAALGITRQARCWGGQKGTAWVAQMQIGGILGDDLQVDVGEPLSLLKWRRVCRVV